MKERDVLSTLVERLQKIGINITLAGNAPWIYLNSINGVRVTEKFYANHGFTIAFYPRGNEKLEILDIIYGLNI